MMAFRSRKLLRMRFAFTSTKEAWRRLFAFGSSWVSRGRRLMSQVKGLPAFGQPLHFLKGERPDRLPRASGFYGWTAGAVGGAGEAVLKSSAA